MKRLLHNQMFLFFFFLIAPSLSIYAQLHNHLWWFGKGGVGIQFSPTTNLPSPVNNQHKNSSLEGMAMVVDDPTGDFLFYTNGQTVFNQNHEIIKNGNGLSACASSANAAAIAPVPGNKNQYYVFSNGTGSSCHEESLHYSIVDLAADVGKGEILSDRKNILLQSEVLEGMHTIPKTNSEDYWLLTTQPESSGSISIQVYTITDCGIIWTNEFLISFGNRTFSMRYSPMSKQVAICFIDTYRVIVFDFDATSGILSNPQIIFEEAFPIYDIEWSPDGSKLYGGVVHDVKLLQYDFSSGSTTSLHQSDKDGGGLKLGPDQKIYFIHNSDSDSLSVIEKPNELGFAADFNKNAYHAGDPINSFQFPKIIPATAFSPLTNGTIQGIINQYAQVENLCGNALILPNPSPFTVGDTVLLYQAQGAVANLKDTLGFGEIINYGNAGNYEFNQIEAIQGNKILLKFQLQKTYDLQNLQLILVPNLGNAHVENLTCKAWDNNTGGVLAFFADTLNLKGDIDVSGAGFRGGAYSNGGEFPTCGPTLGLFYASNEADSAGLKGQGIVIEQDRFARGKAALGNGGGGGNNHNSGGGGGANWGKGGMGGIYPPCQVPTTLAQNQGFGGNSLNHYPNGEKLFMGGGGGAGHSNNDMGTHGGNGGGLIIIFAKHIISGGFSFKSNGTSALNPFSIHANDGGGGGGGGGTIALYGDSYDTTTPLQVEVKGGKGTDVELNHGHGGGGGGGFFLSSTLPPFSLLSLDVSGGPSGKGVGNIFNGATPGTAGQMALIDKPLFPSQHYPPLKLEDLLIKSNCDGTAYLEIKASGGEASYQHWINGSDSVPGLITDTLTNGNYLITLSDVCWQKDSQILIPSLVPLEAVLEYRAIRRCDSLAQVYLEIAGGATPFQFYLNDLPESNALFSQLEGGNYNWLLIDSFGCQLEGSFDIIDFSEELLVNLPADTTIGKWQAYIIQTDIDTSNYGPYTFVWWPRDQLSCFDCINPIVDPTRYTTYEFTATDAFGCIGKDTICIETLPPTVFVPNVFSPNQDTHNDYFFLQGSTEQIKVIKSLSVYNRWGETLFQKQNIPINDPTSGWDGRLDGKVLSPQVLVYWGEVELTDGRLVRVQGDFLLKK